MIARSAVSIHPETWWCARHLDADVISKPWRPPAWAVGVEHDVWLPAHVTAAIGGIPDARQERAALGLTARLAGRAGWTVTPSKVEGELLVFTRGTERRVMVRPGVETPDACALQVGAIVGAVHVLAVEDRGVAAAWKQTEAYGWRVEVRCLPQVVPCAGGQRLWTLAEDLHAQVLAQLGERC